jgi:hypothetical protein
LHDSLFKKNELFALLAFQFYRNKDGDAKPRGLVMVLSH